MDDIKADLASIPPPKCSPSIVVEDTDTEKPRKRGSDEGSSDLDVPSNQPGMEDAAEALWEELGFSNKSRRRKARSPSPTLLINDALVWTVHILPLTAQEEPRYGPCRVAACSHSEGRVQLEWLSEVQWKHGEKNKNTRWIGDREGNSLAFTTSSQVFLERRAHRSSVPIEKVGSFERELY